MTRGNGQQDTMEFPVVQKDRNQGWCITSLYHEVRKVFLVM